VSAVYVRLGLAGEQYALGVEDVVEIAELGEVTPVPGTSGELLGVRNLRGQVLPIIDLATVFGVAAPHVLERVVVVEEATRLAGLAVERVIEVGPMPDPTQGAESGYLKGAALVDGALVGVIDLPALLEALTGAGT
jgi:purine-binding chemotaxis protein CheW